MTKPTIRDTLFPRRPAPAPERPRAGITNPEEARTIIAGVRETTEAEKEGRARGERLVSVPARIIPGDYETLKEMGERYARDPSFLVRVAVHVFAEAHRNNPRALG